MPALTHVCMWSEHGWERITAEEASRLHPGGTVSAHSGLFMCELCGQYVTLTDGEQKVRYFRHSAYEERKDCPERTFGAYAPITYMAGAHELPIRLVHVTDSDFDLELGLILIPPEILSQASAKQIKITESRTGKQFVYSFERLNSDSITYVSLGNEPAKSYSLQVDAQFEPFWPKRVEGISEDGCLFDGKSGKKLVNDADVVVGKKYYLLTKSQLYTGCRSVEYRLICTKQEVWNPWHIYEIYASAFDENAARFFLNLHYRLTDSPVSLQTIWPIYEETPYVIRHSHSSMYMHMTGRSGVQPKTFPIVRLRQYRNSMGETAIHINCSGRQQLIAAGRAGALEYTYMWKEPLDEVTETPDIQVTDIRGIPIPDSIKNRMPEKGILSIQAPYDGKIKILHQGTVRECINLKAEIKTDADQLRFGDVIQVYQGLDKVWETAIEKSSGTGNPDESELLRKLEAAHEHLVPIDHSAGAMAAYLADCPKLKLWLREQIRKGVIPEKALKMLRQYILTIKV